MATIRTQKAVAHAHLFLAMPGVSCVTCSAGLAVSGRGFWFSSLLALSLLL